MRRKTREITVGTVGIGGDNPVRIQSMTTSDTKDAIKTANEIMQLADAGCELARVTVQGKKEAYSCEEIKNYLLQKGYTIPLIADIHFYPPAAMVVADFVDKVRINPGNFLDRRATFKKLEYTEESYQKEVERIFEEFSPLVKKLKEQKKALRIGTNHGSLSDRILNRYGDTPFGMVESAFEFARVCRKHDFHNFCFSMKSSNPLVMIEAYRLLVLEMDKLGWDYPIHLGVTEAGEGEDGRIKSSVGIGTLLLDGIGDTIRISLTEDPIYEIDPCKRLINLTSTEAEFSLSTRSTLSPSLPKGFIILKVSSDDVLQENFFDMIGARTTLLRPEKGLSTVDGIYLEELPSDCTKLKQLQAIGVEVFSKEAKEGFIPVVTPKEAHHQKGKYALYLEDPNELGSLKPSYIFFAPKNRTVPFTKELVSLTNGITPIFYVYTHNHLKEDLIIDFSAKAGSLLCDQRISGAMINTSHALSDRYRLVLDLMQACRLKSFKTEFISCPSCGRTLFDLQKVSKRIREQTAHLPGVKIAIMGCIVNGPGEMADADFGYVGSRPGKIDLYVGKECVEKNIDMDEADKKLIELIKEHGKWIDPEILESVSSVNQKQ